MKFLRDLVLELQSEKKELHKLLDQQPRLALQDKKLLEEYKNAINYPYGQVVFDTFNISMELDNLSNIYNTYMPQIIFGKAEDPEAYVAEFRAQLVAAGYETCLEEIQRQLDEVYK